MNQTRRNPRYIFLLALLVAAVVALTYPLWSPYFINDVVDEAFPGLDSAERESVRAMPEAQRDVLLEMSEDKPDMAADTARAMMADDKVMDDNMPADATAPSLLSNGSWIEIDPVHRAEGSASIWLVGDTRVLRFEDFRVTNGPKLHVLLTKNVPTSIFAGVEDYIDLGPLKGNIGNQNYDIPPELDLSEYRSAVIYCMPFHVVFSSAELLPAQ